MAKKLITALLTVLLLFTNSNFVYAEDELTAEEKEDLAAEFIAGSANNKNASFTGDSAEDIGETLWKVIETNELETKEETKKGVLGIKNSFINGVITIGEKMNQLFQKIWKVFERDNGAQPNGETEIKETIYPNIIQNLYPMNYNAIEYTSTQTDEDNIQVNITNAGSYYYIRDIEKTGITDTEDLIARVQATQTNNRGEITLLNEPGPARVYYGKNYTEQNKTISINFDNNNNGLYYVILHRYSNLEEDQNNYQDRLDSYTTAENLITSRYNIENVGNANNTNTIRYSSDAHSFTLQPGGSYIAVFYPVKGIATEPEIINGIYGNLLKNYTGTIGNQEYVNKTTIPESYSMYVNFPVLMVDNEAVQENETQFTITTNNLNNTYKTPEIAYNYNYYQNIGTENTQANGEAMKSSILQGLDEQGTTINGYQQEIIDKYTGLELDLEKVDQQNNAYYQGQQQGIEGEDKENVDNLLENENQIHNMTDEQQEIVNNGFENNGIGIDNPFSGFQSGKFLTSANGVKTQLTGMMNTKIGIIVDIALILGLLALIIGRK